MSMNWHQRHHGWTCSDCGTFNEQGNFNCDSEECEMERDREERIALRRYLCDLWNVKRRHRWSPANVYIAGMTGTLYRCRRFVGKRVQYSVVVSIPDPTLSYIVEGGRVPPTVRTIANAYFGI